MDLFHILVFTLPAVTIAWLTPYAWRAKVLLVTSAIGIYWLQPILPIRNMDFWLPTLTIGLTVLVWTITRTTQTNPTQNGIRPPLEKDSWIALLLLAAVVLIISLTRYFQPLCCLTPTRPPPIWQVSALLLITAVLILISLGVPAHRDRLATVTFILIVLIFFVLKSELLSRAASGWLRQLFGQTASLATAFDLRWLGYSYLAFRLLHVLRDFQTKRLPAYNLDDFVAYALFWPAFTAGPIDRSQHFIGELRQVSSPGQAVWPAWSPQEFPSGGYRILTGILKKFVLADTLALVALNQVTAFQTHSSFWLWAMLVAYSLYIYLDFSGYTDLAIGFGRLIGIHLPENFDRPYQKSSLVAFWNSWNITLAQWFRSYYFNPLTRALRTRYKKLASWIIILLSQVSTMVLIGLWHGLSWNFLFWGLWHGFGLFVNNRWSAWITPRLGNLEMHSFFERTLQLGGWFLTFTYVTLGWVWFVVPAPGAAGAVYARLFGL
jgi:D-alanyl-lipoteichoic acid acyltransferase DltB (MBOAT superfamily)